MITVSSGVNINNGGGLSHYELAQFGVSDESSLNLLKRSARLTELIDKSEQRPLSIQEKVELSKLRSL
jgi:hypothetical protein